MLALIQEHDSELCFSWIAYHVVVVQSFSFSITDEVQFYHLVSASFLHFLTCLPL